MNFLELCAKLTLESGAIGQAPVTTVGVLPRRQAQCVGWIKTAYVLIQNHSAQFNWLRARFEGELEAGQARYSPTDILLAAAPRFAEWVGEAPRRPALTLYRPEIGRKDETWLRQITEDQWSRSYDFGVHDPSRPVHWAASYDGSLLFGQTPDAAYRVRGEYLMTPQVLAADNDVPDMPARFHDLIWQRAIMLMAASDEAVQSLQTAQLEFSTGMKALVRDCLPTISAQSERSLDQR